MRKAVSLADNSISPKSFLFKATIHPQSAVTLMDFPFCHKDYEKKKKRNSRVKA